MSRATSSTRSVMITKSLVPRISWACCATCTLTVPSSPKLELLGSEHTNGTLWPQRTGDPKLRPPQKLSFWTFCTANGGGYGYYKGQIERRFAHSFAVHVATQRGLAERPQHRHPPRAQP